MVRGLASDLPAGVDLSKAKAWINFNMSGTIYSSYNIKSITTGGTGIVTVAFGAPMKAGRADGDSYAIIFGTNDDGGPSGPIIATNGSNANANRTKTDFLVNTEYTNSAGTKVGTQVYAVIFGELENE
jgi:hypothetical protein